MNHDAEALERAAKEVYRVVFPLPEIISWEELYPELRVSYRRIARNIVETYNNAG